MITPYDRRTCGGIKMMNVPVSQEHTGKKRKTNAKLRRVTVTVILITIVAAGLLCSSMAKAVTSGEQENRVSARLELLRGKYPHNCFWNHEITRENVGKTVNGTWDETWCESVTEHPCNHSFDRIGQYGCNAFDHGIACWGFANRVFYEVFGIRAYSLERRYDVENISVGDHVRFRYNHSAIVLSCSGSKVTLLECNYNNSECRIQWERTEHISNIIWYQHADNWDRVANGEYEGIGSTSGACGLSLTWSIENGVLSINGTGKMYSYSSTVGPGWESRKSAINAVVIGSGATSVGAYAFYGCANLLSVEMADTVTEIEGHAFQECAAVAEVGFPNKLLSIGEYAFSGCRALAELNLPARLSTIGRNAFVNNKALMSLDVPDSVTGIGIKAWYGCSGIKTLHLPGSIDAVPNSAFEGCRALEEADIDEGVKTIGGRAFCGNGNPMKLKTIHIPSTLTTVKADAFGECDQITDVWFGGDMAAADAISISDNNSGITDALWHYNVGTVSPDDPSLRTVALPDNLLIVEEEAFANARTQKIIVPSRVKTIKDHAFLNCRNLIYLELLNGNTSIADNALEGCDSVTVICPANSSVENWAKEKGYPVQHR